MVISSSGMRSMRGPTSWYLDGRRSSQTFGGSITWSSTLMILGRSAAMCATVSCGPDGPSKTGGCAMTDALGFERDPDFIRRSQGLLGLYSEYFDAEVRG